MENSNLFRCEYRYIALFPECIPVTSSNPLDARMKRDVNNTNLITIGIYGRGNVFMRVYITRKKKKQNRTKKTKGDFETPARCVADPAKSFSECC